MEEFQIRQYITETAKFLTISIYIPINDWLESHFSWIIRKLSTSAILTDESVNLYSYCLKFLTIICNPHNRILECIAWVRASEFHFFIYIRSINYIEKDIKNTYTCYIETWHSWLFAVKLKTEKKEKTESKQINRKHIYIFIIIKIVMLNVK